MHGGKFRELLPLLTSRAMKSSTKGRMYSEALLEQLKIPSLSTLLRCNWLRWYGHVQRNDGGINDALYMQIDGENTRGRPKKTWLQSVTQDCRAWNLPKDATDRLQWRSTMKNCMQD